MGKKLVAIFALQQDNFIVTQNLSLIYQIRDFLLWINPLTETVSSFTVTSKNCATNAFCSYQLAVMLHAIPAKKSIDLLVEYTYCIYLYGIKYKS